MNKKSKSDVNTTSDKNGSILNKADTAADLTGQDKRVSARKYDNGKIQIEPTSHMDEYDSKKRFCSYWHQIHEIASLEAQEVVEVGIGNGFASTYLKERGFSVTTLDIDKRLNPNIAASVLMIPLASQSFEVVACFEVLEHLPYDYFGQALSEILRVSKKYVVLSVPDTSRVCSLSLELPLGISIKAVVSLPNYLKLSRFNIRVQDYCEMHQWEIGAKGYPLSRIKEDIRKAGFKIKRTYRVLENPWHRFFIMEKI